MRPQPEWLFRCRGIQALHTCVLHGLPSFSYYKNNFAYHPFSFTPSLNSWQRNHHPQEHNKRHKHVHRFPTHTSYQLVQIKAIWDCFTPPYPYPGGDTKHCLPNVYLHPDVRHGKVPSNWRLCAGPAIIYVSPQTRHPVCRVVPAVEGGEGTSGPPGRLKTPTGEGREGQVGIEGFIDHTTYWEKDANVMWL